MSSGQRPRSREFFPRMNDRAGRRRRRRTLKKWAAVRSQFMPGSAFVGAAGALLVVGQAFGRVASVLHGFARAVEKEQEQANEAWWNQGLGKK